MNDPNFRPRSSLPELSWTAALLIIAGVIIVVLGGITLLQRSEESEPQPAAKAQARGPARGDAALRVPPKVSREVAELRKKVEELERERQAEDADDQKTAQAAVELLAQALAGGQQGTIEEPGVELASGPFTKVSSTIAQVTFSLSNPGRRVTRVPVQVTLFRDGLEVGTKTQLFEIGARELRAYSVLFQVSGAGNYAASVDLVNR